MLTVILHMHYVDSRHRNIAVYTCEQHVVPVRKTICIVVADFVFLTVV
jgi:hypothetical protein